MLEIKLIGGEMSGKTSHAIGLAMNYSDAGKRVLFVCFSADLAAFHRKNSGCKDVVFIGSREFNKAVLSSQWDLIILDELSKFAKNSEGSYVQLAKKRLQLKEFGTLAYTIPSDRKWVSTAIWWKPRTWGSGYWTY